jgi:hypothetical protein
MTSDRARVTYDPSRHYTGVIAQQGRVSLEADWNEAQAISDEQAEARALDLIGPVASPDEGYEIEVDYATGDVRIEHGTLYLGGQRLCLSSDLRYCHQREFDWVDCDGDRLWLDARDDDQPHELVYLLAREQEVSAVEDRALREVALGGPDTAQRLRILQRVIRHPTSAATWEDAWAKLIQEHWIPHGFRPDRDTRRLEPAARLQVTGSPGDGGAEPIDQGGYLGPNNQLIRIQIARIDDGVPIIVWGYDNASFLYRLISSTDSKESPASTTLKLATAPVDAYHQPAEGQAVEILRSAAFLADHDYIAATTGRVVKVITAYDPDCREVVVDGEVPTQYKREAAEHTPPLFLRVWQGEFRCEPGKEHELGRTGIRIRLTAAEHGRTDGFPVGAYWMIALRPGVGPDSPGLLYPQRILDRPQPPDGPRQWLAPVAFVRWHPRSPHAEDCIPRFESLARLERLGGSCTIRVRAEDVGGGWALQDIIDTHSSRDHPVTICLEPGDYVLPRPLRIGPQHGRLTIRAARPGVVLRAERESAARFLLGLIIAREADGLRLEGLEIQPPHASLVLERDVYQHQPERARAMIAAHRHRAISIGLHATRCTSLTICDCRLTLSLPAPPDHDRSDLPPEQDLFAAGIFAAEELRGLRVEGCTFSVRGPITHAWRRHNGEAADGRHHVALGFVHVPTATAVPHDADRDDAEHAEPRGSASVPLLDDAFFHGNLFEHLTAPLVAIGQLGAIRADRNTVRACHAGFWLVTQHASHVLTLLDRLVNQIDDAYRDLVKAHLTALAEPLVFHTTVLARTLPHDLTQDLDEAASPRLLEPPSTAENRKAAELLHQLSTPDATEEPPGSAQREIRMRRFLERFGRVITTRQQSAEVAVPPEAAVRCFLDVTENSFHSGAAPALVVLNTAPESAASVIMTGNQLRSNVRPGAVACLYLLRTCAVTANIIVNGETENDDAASLLVLPRHQHRRHQAAITGNVLDGKAHLPDRPDDLPRWAWLNSVTRS